MTICSLSQSLSAISVLSIIPGERDALHFDHVAGWHEELMLKHTSKQIDKISAAYGLVRGAAEVGFGKAVGASQPDCHCLLHILKPFWICMHESAR